MSDVVGQIALELGIDSSQIVNQLTGASNKAAKQATSIFSGMGKKIAGALSIAAFAKFTKDCIEVGSNVTEVQNVVDTAFGDLSRQADLWASNAMTNFGLSELSAKKYMGVFGQMSNAMGITGQAALDMAEDVTGLTGDVASFYNLGTDEAYTKLKSIWTGETETLKDLGVVMTQTNLDQYALNNGFGKTTAKMTEQEKVMLRYQYVTSALSNATGDFVKTQDSWANQTRILTLRFEQLKASLGKGFIALFTPILRGLNNVLADLQKVADGFATFTQMLTGADISSSASAITGLGDIASDTADNVSGIGDAASSTAKQIEKSLAGFDQIEKLSEPTDSSSSSGGGTSSGGISVAPSTQEDTTNAASAISDFVNKAKKELNKLRKWSVSTFSPSMSKIWDGLTKNTDTAKKNLTSAFNDIKALGPPLLNYFNGPFTNYLVTWVDTNGSILNGLFDSFNTVFSDVWNKAAYPILANFVSVGLPMLTDFASQTLSLNGTIFDTFKASWNSLWSEGVSPAIESISNVWIGLVNTMAGAWNEWGEPIFTGIKTAVKTTGDVFLDIWNNMLQPVWENALDVIDRVWSEHLQPLLANFLDFVGEVVTCATTIYNNFIAPVVGFLSELLEPIFIAIFDSIGNKVGVVVGTIADLMNDTITVFKGVIQFIKGVFSGDWEGAWNGIVTAFDGIFSGIADIAKGPINMVIGMINGLLSGMQRGINAVVKGVNKLSFKVPNWVPGIGGEDFGFHLPQANFSKIPYLAQGGYVKPNTPQLAMIGDNRHQGEIVAPEDKIYAQAYKAVEAVMRKTNDALESKLDMIIQLLMQILDRTADGDLIMQVGEAELGRIVKRAISNYNRRYNRVTIEE